MNTIWLVGIWVSLATMAAPQPVSLWEGLPPGESIRSRGEPLPKRAMEDPPATRITRITEPTLELFQPPPQKRNGLMVVILPGGGFNYVVVDKEGSEIAAWLNSRGITAGVLRYRTKNESAGPHWERPLQDLQRTVSLVRHHAQEWQIDPGRIGVMGLSAGGHVAARGGVLGNRRTYAPRDAIDRDACGPNFLMLIYPWNLWDPKERQLANGVRPDPQTPPTFLIHAHDDGSSSLGSVWFYAGLKEAGVPAELHVYQRGGHGYGIRPVPGTVIHTWKERAESWVSQFEQGTVPTR